MNDIAKASGFIREVRIDPELTGRMIHIAAADTRNAGIANRLETDKCFLSRALHMGHEILVATTIAQSAKADYAFDDLLMGMGFSGNDHDLKTIGRVLINKIMSAQRIPDPEVPDNLLVSRFGAVLAAV